MSKMISRNKRVKTKTPRTETPVNNLPNNRRKIVPPEITVINDDGNFDLDHMPDIKKIDSVRVDLVSVDHYIYEQKVDYRSAFQNGIQKRELLAESSVDGYA